MMFIQKLLTVLVITGVMLPNLAWALPEKTVVIRVVGTNTAWGQEQKPGWPNASPVKDAPGYSLYDLEIGRVPGPNDGDSEVPGYLALYKFKGYLDPAGLPKAFTSYGVAGEYLEDSVFGQYKTQSTVKKVNLSRFAKTIDWNQNSRELLAALKTLIDQIVKREKNVTRWVLSFSGYDAPRVRFEEMLSNSDSEILMNYLRQKTGKKPLILDFSTNSEIGFFDFALRYYRYADYLLASDKQVGGYELKPGSIEEWLAHDSDYVYDKTWQSTNTLNQAFSKTIQDLETVWYLSRDSLKERQVEQSLSIYKLSSLPSLMTSLKSHGLTSADLPLHSSDLATYAYNSGDSTLIQSLENFRIGYTSDRAYTQWTDNSQGFSVGNPYLLDSYLGKLP